MSVFERLNAVNVNEHTEKKNELTYLSWVWAWGELKKLYPNSSYTIYENPQGWNYFTDGRTCWVKTGVTAVDENGEAQELIEYLPVMDYRNNSIPADKVTSFDVNKAIQRSLTKAIARHGLGLYIYAGEDLPEEEAEKKAAEKDAKYDAPQPRRSDAPATMEKPAATVAEAETKKNKPFDRAEIYAKLQKKLGLEDADMATLFNGEREAMNLPENMTDDQYKTLITKLWKPKEANHEAANKA